MLPKRQKQYVLKINLQNTKVFLIYITLSNLGLLSGLKLSVCERKKKVNNFSYLQGGGHDWEQFSTPWIK